MSAINIKRKAISSSLMLLFTAGIGLPAKTTLASLVCKQPGFAEPVGLAATGTVPIAVAPGDFDLDGKPDLAVANQTSNTVGLLFGDGAGEFAALDPGLGVSNPVAVTVGNFDDSTEDDASNPDPNNAPDVAVMSGDSTLSLFFSHGNRAFSSRIIGNLDNMAGGNIAGGMAQGDFNGDGHLDLAVTVAPNTLLPSDRQLQGVMILSGNGLKVFTPSFYRTDFVPLQFVASRSIGVGDFNQDGRPDLAIAGTDAAQQALGILFNDGQGGFNAQKINFNWIEAVTVNDFNGDGYPDVAVAGHDYQGTSEASVSILLNNQNQTFARSDISVAAWRSAPFTIISADFNFDHNPDLVVGGTEVTDPYAGNLTVLLGDGTGKFGDIASVRAGLKAYSLAVGDFNGDGQADVVETDRSSQVTLLPGGGAVGFRLSDNFSVGRSGSNAADETPQSIASGDLNGDGYLDLVTANSQFDDTISVLLNDLSGKFPIPQLYGAGNGFEQPFSVALSDFNQDGDLDVAALTKATNQVKVLPGAGISGLGTAVAFSVGTAPVSEAVGDFNGDGQSDLAVANSGSDNVSVLLGDGTGGFAPKTDFITGVFPKSVIAADVNGDNHLDLAVANSGSDTVSVLLGDGAGSFGTAANFGVGDQPFSLTSGDFNEDGKLDLATANSVGTVSLLQGDGTGSFTPAENLPVGIDPRSVQAGDFDMDGHADLAVANYGSGDLLDVVSNNVAVLLGDGKGGFAQPVDFAVGNNASVSRPVSITVGDFDRTGSLDLATALIGQRAVSVLSNCAASPVTTIHADPAAPNPQGWYTSPVKFRTTAVDSTGNPDGIAETRCAIMAPPTGETVTFNALPPGNNCASGLTTAAEGSNSFYAASQDTGGNQETVQQATVKIDTIPPTIAGSKTPAANGSGWNNSNVTVDFTCNDSTSGIASCTKSRTLLGEGANQSADGEATDNAGNSATTTVGGISIDKTPPMIAGNPSPAANGNGWNNSNVTVSFNCSDSLSGIASCSPNRTFLAEGANQSMSGEATDNAGNSAQTIVSGISIDKTAPTTACSVASPMPILTLGGAGTVEATVTDALSGPVVSPASAPANVASVGNKTVSLIGADRAGNTQPATCPYRVKYGFSGFQGISSTYRIGSTIPVVFKLTYADGSPLPSTEAASLAAGCLVKVGLDAANACATYKKKGLFTANIKVGFQYLGTHPIVADVFAPNGSGLVNHETTPVNITR